MSNGVFESTTVDGAGEIILGADVEAVGENDK